MLVQRVYPALRQIKKMLVGSTFPSATDFCLFFFFISLSTSFNFGTTHSWCKSVNSGTQRDSLSPNCPRPLRKLGPIAQPTMAWDHWVANGKPFERSDMSKNSRPDLWLLVLDWSTCSFKINQQIHHRLGGSENGRRCMIKLQKCGPNKKNPFMLKFTSSFSPKLVKSLIWNSSPWSHLTPRSNNQASFIQGHLQHLDQGWHDFQGSRAYLLHHSIQLIQPTCFTRLRFLAAAAGAGAKLHCTRPLRSSCFSGHSGSPSDNWRSQQTNRGFKTHYRLVLSPWTQRQLKDPTTECRPSCFKLSLWPSPLQNLPT